MPTNCICGRRKIKFYVLVLLILSLMSSISSVSSSSSSPLLLRVLLLSRVSLYPAVRLIMNAADVSYAALRVSIDAGKEAGMILLAMQCTGGDGKRRGKGKRMEEKIAAAAPKS
jgi:hypothetical protein